MKQLKFCLCKHLCQAVATFLLLILLSSCGDTGDAVRIQVPQDSSAFGNKNHFIPREEIEAFKTAFNIERDSLLRKQKNLFIPVSEAFNKPSVLEILKLPGCVGIKVYYGVKKGDLRNEIRLILVGVDAKGNDLYYVDPKGLGVKAVGQAEDDGGKTGGTEYGQCTPPCDDDD